MTALYIAPRVPVVDPQTGLANPIWYRFFTSLFSIAGDGAVADTIGFEVAPVAADSSALAQLLAQALTDHAPVAQSYVTVVDDLTPASQQYFINVDDVIPIVTGLRDEIEMLRRDINDIRQGVGL